MRRLTALVFVAVAIGASIALGPVGVPAARAATPVAAIAAATTPVQAGTPLELRADGLEAGATAAWDFGDGTTGAGPVVTHAWAAAGTFTVVLTVTGTDGSVAIATTAVTVTAAPAPAPDASFSSTPATPRVGLLVAFAVRAPQEGVTYAWDFGDGTTGTGATAQHAYARVGPVVVALTATAPGGSVATATATLRVQPPLLVEPAIVASAERVVQGRAVAFRAVPATGRAVWIFGDGSRATGASVRHTFRRPDTYRVILAVTDAYGRVASARVTIVVTAPGAPDPDGGSTPAADDLPTLRGPSQRSRKDPLYSAAAATLAGGQRAALCWSTEHWKTLTRRASDRPGFRVLGYVDLRQPRRINLAPGVCAELDAFTARPGRATATSALATAVDTLVHEAVHTLGVRDEATTECYAMQNVEEVARRLGATKELAAALVDVLWRDYSKESMPEGYWSAECRNGGEHDLDPDSDLFP